MDSNSRQTLPPGLMQSFAGTFKTDWGGQAGGEPARRGQGSHRGIRPEHLQVRGDATVERVRFSVPAGRLYLFDPDQDSRTVDLLW